MMPPVSGSELTALVVMQCTFADSAAVTVEVIGERWRRPSLRQGACEEGMRGRRELERAS
jgi:hypothetical protein